MLEKTPWDIDAIAQALRAETEVCYSPGEGKGIRFLVGLSYTKLDTWEKSGHLYLLSPSVELHAWRMHPAVIGETDVIFQGGRRGAYRFLGLSKDGTFHTFVSGTQDRRLLTQDEKTDFFKDKMGVE